VNSQSILSVGAVEKYSYCPLSWWLSREGAEEEEETLAKGERKHEVVVKDLKGIETHEVRAHEHETIVLYFAVAATVAALLGVTFLQNITVRIGEIVGAIALIWLLAACYFLYKAEMLATEKEKMVAERVILIFAMVATLLAVYMVSASFIVDPILSHVTEVVALMWLIGASFFLYHSIRGFELARVLRRKHGLMDKIVDYYDDQSRNTELFISEKYGLRGRPDYIVTQGNYHIPVEVKTGRTPKGPLFSHIVQLGAYCLLMEDKYDMAPPYGILRYEKTEHEIEYGIDLKNLVTNKLIEMQDVLKTGEAHRNHNRPGKCIGCSRRSVCPEKLA